LPRHTNSSDLPLRIHKWLPDCPKRATRADPERNGSVVKFTLVKRRSGSKGHRAIYYCRIRADEVRCVSWRSTGETEKSKAFRCALRRLKNCDFLTDNITFARYAEGWWEPECEWVRRQAARGRSTAPGIWRATGLLSPVIFFQRSGI